MLNHRMAETNRTLAVASLVCMPFAACATGDQNLDVGGLADAGLVSADDSAGGDSLGNPSTSGASTGTDIGASGTDVGTSGTGVGTSGSSGTSAGASSGSTASGASSGSFSSGMAASGSATGSASGSATTGSATSGSATSGSATSGTGGNCKSNVLPPKVATALSQMQPAANAIDGKFNTYWESTHGVDLEWIYLDFGAPVFINRVQIAWGASCAADYTLAVSADKTNWTTIKTITGNAMGTAATAPPTDWVTAMPVDSMGLSGVGRYLRVNATKRCSIHGYAIWEMRAFGDTNAACTP